MHTYIYTHVCPIYIVMKICVWTKLTVCIHMDDTCIEHVYIYIYVGVCIQNHRISFCIFLHFVSGYVT